MFKLNIALLRDTASEQILLLGGNPLELKELKEIGRVMNLIK